MSEIDPHYDVALMLTSFVCDGPRCRAILHHDLPYDPDVLAAKARSLGWYADSNWHVLCPACRKLLGK